MSSGSPRNGTEDTSTWLKCADASDLLRVSENTIRTWARRGYLHPQLARRARLDGAVHEVEVFDPKELAVVAARRRVPMTAGGPGEVAASAFEMFDGGTSLREVVIQLRQTPQLVAELHDQWLEFGGARLVVGAAAKVELVRLVGEFDDIAGLVDRVSSALACRIEVSVEDGTPLARASDAVVERAILGVIGGADAGGATPAGTP